jgi:hypothetical protein
MAAKKHLKISSVCYSVMSSDTPHSGGIYNELAKSMTSLCSANTLAEFIMSLQNLQRQVARPINAGKPRPNITLLGKPGPNVTGSATN